MSKSCIFIMYKKSHIGQNYIRTLTMCTEGEWICHRITEKNNPAERVQTHMWLTPRSLPILLSLRVKTAALSKARIITIRNNSLFQWGSVYIAEPYFFISLVFFIWLDIYIYAIISKISLNFNLYLLRRLFTIFF